MSDRPTQPAAPLDDDDPRVVQALFRYRVIADLVTLVLTPGELTALVRDAAQKRYRQPDGSEASFSARTIWTWLARFRKGGLDALLPSVRKDKGALRAISAEALERAAVFRREDRSRSARTIVDMLERDGQLGQGAASRQTIDRALRRMDLARIRPGRAPDKIRRRIEVAGPNALWVGDYHDLAGVPLTGGATLRSHLSAFIDHWSRYIVHAAYYPSQAIYTLEDTFKKAILKAGRPEKVYVDNAKIYRAHLAE
jgi:transposase InsO family protein